MGRTIESLGTFAQKQPNVFEPDSNTRECLFVNIVQKSVEIFNIFENPKANIGQNVQKIHHI